MTTDCWQDGVRADNEKCYKLIKVCVKVVVVLCVIRCDFGCYSGRKGRDVRLDVDERGVYASYTL